MSFRANVLQLLDSKGITQKELAELMGKSPQNISILLRADRQLTLATVQEFANALQVDPSDLLDSQTEEPTIRATQGATTPYQRLFDYFLFKGFHPDDIFKKSGIPYIKLYNNAVKRVDMTDHVAMAVSNGFPDLNMTWLLSGEGDMLKEANDQTTLENPKLLYQRIWDFLIFARVDFDEFCRKSAMTPEQLILGLRGKLPAGAVEGMTITKAFPQVNLVWLLTGEGNMVLDEYDKIINIEPVSTVDEGVRIALDEDATEIQILKDSDRMVVKHPLVDEGSAFAYRDGYGNLDFLNLDLPKYVITTDSKEIGAYRSYEANLVGTEILPDETKSHKVIYTGIEVQRLTPKILKDSLSLDFLILYKDRLLIVTMESFNITSKNATFKNVHAPDEILTINFPEIEELYRIDVVTYYRN